MVAMSVQIIFIRELMAVFEGNELVIGLCMGLWMLLTAAGAFLGSVVKTGRSFTKFSSKLLYFCGITPLAMVLVFPEIVAALVVPGTAPGFIPVITITALTLAPFCLLSGFLFPILAEKLASQAVQNPVQKAYALDAAGSIAGGILFSLAWVPVSDTSQNLILLALVCTATTIAGSVDEGKPRIAFLMAFITTVSVLVFVATGSGKRATDRLFPGQEVIRAIDTPSGKLTLTRNGNQINLFDNHSPVALDGDVANNEESVHYAMLLHPNPLRVLMISGGLQGAISEALKYPGARIDYLELNPWSFRLISEVQGIPENERLQIVRRDPVLFIREGGPAYDVILLNTPNPENIAGNRFYTIEFMRLIRNRLAVGGILCLSIPAAGQYMSEPSRVLHSSLLATLSRLFSNVRIIPGQRDYFLASEQPLREGLMKYYEELGMDNAYVNPGYISDATITERSRKVLENLIPDAQVNSFLNPVIYKQSVLLWAGKTDFDLRILSVTIAALVLVFLILARPVNLGLFTGGFTVSSLELILIIWLQAYYGHAYRMTGLIFAAFMAGMATGSHFMPFFIKKASPIDFIKAGAGIGSLALLIGAAILMVPYMTPAPVIVALTLFFAAIAGLLMGIQYASGVQLRQASVRKSAGEAFSSDLLGSAAGALMLSVFLIPIAGLIGTFALLIALNIFVLMKLSIQSRTGSAFFH
jgi:spermidine synthase